jgi:NADPH-dependent glutamate synthase beta subunit-like oxidoreductase/CO/xanthine dehydrogenase FAD-binding subunit
MHETKYYRPSEITDAVEILSNENHRVIAGGTDLLGTMREKILSHSFDGIVSLKDIDESYGIQIMDDSSIHIGSMARLVDIAENEAIQNYIPLLSKAAGKVASPQIRNVATIGGNICQEPRCWYYRYQGNKFHCLRKGGKICNALTGRNEYHSIFGAMRVGAPPCEVQCPNHTPISVYIEALKKGQELEAAKLLFVSNPIAAVTGRVCPHTCEAECNRLEFDESLSIREVERYLGDYILDHIDEIFEVPKKNSGKSVALIGSGPVGLVAAFKLRLQGHEVTIIDQNKEIGGMLYYGIPSYRLPKEILKRYKEILEKSGVIFHMEQKIGRDLSLADVRKSHDAVLLGIGAWKSARLAIAGENSIGTIGGIEFLNDVAQGNTVSIGENVIVLGGGNTAMDVCRTAKRLGAKKVTVVYRRTLEEIPADQEEIDEAMTEGVIFRTLLTPIEIIADQDGNTKELLLQKMVLGKSDDSGRRKPIPSEGEHEKMPADQVIVAIGQEINPIGFEDELFTQRGTIFVTEDRNETKLRNVFAAGDAVGGAATAIEAVYDAKKASTEICEILDPAYMAQNQSPKGDILKEIAEETLQYSIRNESKEIPVAERSLLGEDRNSLDHFYACEEASRCFNCGCVAVCPSDIAVALVSLDADIITTQRKIAARDFFAASIESSTILKPGEIVTEIRVPFSSAGNIQHYEKYRSRKTIDFPIISIALNVFFRNGRVDRCAIAVGSVAPIPLRMHETEQFLTGKVIDQDTIEKASEIIVSGAMPLAENSHKITVLSVLFKRILSAELIDH